MDEGANLMNKNILLIGLMLCLLGTAQATELTGDFSLETDCAVPDTAAYVLYNNPKRRMD